MSVGLKLRANDGSVIMDEFTSITTTIAVVNVGRSNGSYTLPADVPGKAGYAIHPGGPTFFAPVITVSSNQRTISWTWPVSGSSMNEEFKMFVGAT